VVRHAKCGHGADFLLVSVDQNVNLTNLLESIIKAAK
jgi:hypothetical protein